ncbi:MAG: thioredoxin family protein [Candidatus Pacearchaeota archaeon]
MRVIGFGAVWCTVCLVMEPRWREVVKENPWVKLKCYDYDKDKEMVKKYNINKNLPIVIFLDKKDREILRLEGEHSKKEIMELVKKYKNK